MRGRFLYYSGNDRDWPQPDNLYTRDVAYLSSDSSRKSQARYLVPEGNEDISFSLTGLFLRLGSVKASPPSSPLTLSYSMTVSTAGVTFGNLGFKRFPGKAKPDHPGKISRLLSSNVIELKQADISTTTVDTGMGR